ncbi:MAG: hypothetical protein ACPGUF_00965 [Litorivicinus sp.]
MWRRSWGRSPGFVLVSFLLALPVLWFSVRGGWQVANEVLASHERQRALDRAAYSGAAKVADTLNAIALHNQGAVGAHLLQGHLVTQMAWTEYAAQLTQRGGAVMALSLPGLGVAMMRGATYARDLQRQQMPIWTQALGAAGQAHQLAAWGRIGQLAATLPALVESTGGGRVQQWAIDPASMVGFGRQAMQGAVLNAAMDGRRWIKTRSWNSSLFWIARLEKRGVTQAAGGQWSASDELSFKIKKWFRTKRVRLAHGAASSSQAGYLGAADLITFKPEHLWFATRAQPDQAVAWARPTQGHALDGVLLWPVWDATHEAQPSSN